MLHSNTWHTANNHDIRFYAVLPFRSRGECHRCRHLLFAKKCQWIFLLWLYFHACFTMNCSSNSCVTLPSRYSQTPMIYVIANIFIVDNHEPFRLTTVDSFHLRFRLDGMVRRFTVFMPSLVRGDFVFTRSGQNYMHEYSIFSLYPPIWPFAQTPPNVKCPEWMMSCAY